MGWAVRRLLRRLGGLGLNYGPLVRAVHAYSNLSSSAAARRAPPCPSSSAAAGYKCPRSRQPVRSPITLRGPPARSGRLPGPETTALAARTPERGDGGGALLPAQRPEFAISHQPGARPTRRSASARAASTTTSTTSARTTTTTPSSRCSVTPHGSRLQAWPLPHPCPAPPHSR
eukprot:scaffold5738_cov61-Phaeocystis_antarctica.AAC.7